ncbi:MAG: rhodanese-related sulfurtransferase [Vicingaceae bacterium]|jgi:rhodanese-related sulfurtransferase
MKNIFYLISLSFFTLTACNGIAQKENSTEQTSKSSYEVLPANEFKAALEKEESPQLIDVRRAGEFSAGTIEGAKNYDILNGSFQKAMETFDKSIPVYVFCAVGGRSGKASALLQENGFTQVIDLKGGYNAWSK